MSGYTENHLIEQPAIQLMEHELGWDGGTAIIERSTSNSEVKESDGHGGVRVEELTRVRSALSLVEANREIDRLLRGGVKVKIPDLKHGGQRTETIFK